MKYATLLMLSTLLVACAAPAKPLHAPVYDVSPPGVSLELHPRVAQRHQLVKSPRLTHSLSYQERQTMLSEPMPQ